MKVKQESVRRVDVEYTEPDGDVVVVSLHTATQADRQNYNTPDSADVILSLTENGIGGQVGAFSVNLSRAALRAFSEFFKADDSQPKQDGGAVTVEYTSPRYPDERVSTTVRTAHKSDAGFITVNNVVSRSDDVTIIDSTPRGSIRTTHSRESARNWMLALQKFFGE